MLHVSCPVRRPPWCESRRVVPVAPAAAFSLWLGLGLVVVAPLLAAAPGMAAPVVTTLEGLCPASADPCTVSQAVPVAGGSRLDVGLRTLRIEGRGLLDFAPGGAEVLCGRLEVDTDAAAIRVRGAAEDGRPVAPVVVTVRRRCSGDAEVACLVDADCEAIGVGRCSAGDGSARLLGSVQGNAERPGRFVLRSAGDLSVHGEISISGTRAVSDGGMLDLESTAGSVIVEATLDASGGGGGSGGSIEILAGIDLDTRGELRAKGGDYDGGTVTLEAERDLTISASIRVDSVAGAGVGGDVDVVAGRDLQVAGGNSSKALLLSADGHQSAENFGGDGGSMTLEADRHLTISQFVRLSSNGAMPDGFADTISLSAGGDLGVEGKFVAKGRGGDGGGGLVELEAQGSVRVASTADLELTGPVAGGDLMIDAGGRLDLAGAVDVGASPTGLGGRVVAVARGDADVSGRLTTAGAANALSVGDLFVEGCRVRVAGSFLNSADAGRNRIWAHESLVVEETAVLSASGEGGSNALSYGNEATTPLVEGEIVPAAWPELDVGLDPCAICGDGVLEGNEACDDGNQLNGDGCDQTCREEHCPGWDEDGTSLPGCDVPDLCTVDATCLGNSCEETGTRSLAVRRLRVRQGRRPADDRILWKLELEESPLPDAPLQGHWHAFLLDRNLRPLLEVTVPAGSFEPRRGGRRFRAVASHPSGATVQAVARVDEAKGRVPLRLRLLHTDATAISQVESLSAVVLVREDAIGSDEPSSSCMNSGALDCASVGRRLLCATARASPE